MKGVEDHTVHGVNSIAHLPVFRLTGAIAAERREFGQRLLDVCARRSISGILVGPDHLYNSRRDGLRSLARRYDLVLVDAALDFPTQLIRIGGHNQSVQDSLTWMGGNSLAMQRFTDRLIEKLNELVRHTPVWGCILIGGKSSRMGRPKHLIEDDRKRTWIERTRDVLFPLVDGLVVSGAGLLPKNLADTVRLADIPGVVGPMTGILAASRWQPTVTWLLIACDMPHVTPEALQWLLSGRRAGCWGRVPRLAENQYFEPLLAWYDYRAGQLFEEQVDDGNLRINEIASHPKIDNPVIPGTLAYGWQNINTPEQLQATAGGDGSRKAHDCS